MTDRTAPSASPEYKGRWLVWGFATLGVLAALAVIWLAIMASGGGPRRPPAVVAANKPGETYEVGSVEQLAGTNLVVIAINAAGRQIGYGSVKSGAANDLRNVLLLDRTTGESRRLLPDNRRPVADIVFLPAEAQNRDAADATPVAADGSRRAPTPVYYLIELAEKRGDQQTISLLAGTLAGPEQQTVMQGLDGVERRWMIDTRRLGMIVREGNGLYFRIVDMIDRKVLQSRKIEIG